MMYKSLKEKKTSIYLGVKRAIMRVHSTGRPLFFNNNIWNWILLLHMIWLLSTSLITANPPYYSHLRIIFFVCIISELQIFTKLHNFLILIIQSLFNSLHPFELYPKLHIFPMKVLIDWSLSKTKCAKVLRRPFWSYLSKQWSLHSASPCV